MQLNQNKQIIQQNLEEMQGTKTLSATQIRYLRIGPRVNQSKVLKQQLIQALQTQKQQEGAQFSMGVGNLNRIPKYGYKQLSRTVSNFGVLVNQNFGNSSSLHQMQKFGKLAQQVDKTMQGQKDKPLEDLKKNADSKTNQKQDRRTFIKSIYNYEGEKVFVVLHSFSLEAIGQNYKEEFPFHCLKVLVSKVGSSRLIRVIQNALSFQAENLEVDFEKVEEKATAYSNHEQKYQNLAYKFQKIGTEFRVNLPYIEFSHLESSFKFIVTPSNKDILDTLSEEFDNIHEIVYKYLDHKEFKKAAGIQQKAELSSPNQNQDANQAENEKKQNQNEDQPDKQGREYTENENQDQGDEGDSQK